MTRHVRVRASSHAGTSAIAPEWALRVDNEKSPPVLYYNSRRNPALRRATPPDSWILCGYCNLEIALKRCCDNETCRQGFFCAICFIVAHRDKGGQGGALTLAAARDGWDTAVAASAVVRSGDGGGGGGVGTPTSALGAAAAAAAPATNSATAAPRKNFFSLRFGKSSAATATADAPAAAPTAAADAVQVAATAASVRAVPLSMAWHVSRPWAPRAASCTVCLDAPAVALCGHAECQHTARCARCEKTAHPAAADHASWRISLIRAEPPRPGK